MHLNKSLQNASLGIKIGTLFILIIIGGLGSALLAGKLPFTGATQLKLIQTIMVVGSMLLPSLIAAFLFSAQPYKEFYLSYPLSRKNAMRIICATLAVSPCINLIHSYNKQITFPSWLSGIEKWMQASEEAAQKATEMLLQTNSIGGLIMNLLIVALLAALSEEFLFRGILFRWVSDTIKNKHWVIWSIAFIFSAIHLQFYGFIPRMLLGAFLGYLLVWTGTLWAPILAHFTNNALGVLLAYRYAGTGEEIAMMEEVGTGDTLWFSVAGAIIFIACIRKIWEERL